MINQKLREFLDSNAVSYRTEAHEPTVDASRTAQAAHVRGREFAKTVIVKADGRLFMTVLPSTDRVHVDQLKQALGARDLELADEDDINAAFPDCEIGAMPPFGNLYNMDVFVSEHLREDEHIVFNAGSHSEVMRMSYQDYDRLVHPQVLHF
ncbi:YbaK/prolyl-tRNA synthetase associated region [Marinobacter lipolyticus SM19]|uniref:YbaK/prolyl-tRNA synthetase associated region n=1 Tax=Marinobacter lipolyticus SM19 TaxID=1318628 RepID=R8B4P9_9GAMM|nr:YbaK/EbsC family protein [Marinobacter lipolyticus]EON93572.1 YbaK/prolyl-tRNA synthetase associated region [Marinobacter lipolyticus SM19]MCG2581151.1 YbaK/EbsC family protein [Marinobacter sp.]